MSFLRTIVNLFASSTDEDLAAEESFKVSFTNVVNSFLFVYSLGLGLNALFLENRLVAVVNLSFSIFFVAYFLFTYIFHKHALYLQVNRVVIFFYVIFAFANGCMLDFAGVSIIIYPFVAIVLHGRRKGVILSLLNLAVMAVYASLPHLGWAKYEVYSVDELTYIFSIQFCSIFVFYVAIRWLSELVYDKIREVAQLNEELKVRKDIVNILTKKLRSPIRDMNAAVDNMRRERMSSALMEQLEIIRASVHNMIVEIEQVHNASEHNIRPIEREMALFNIYNVVCNVLMLYVCKCEDGRHTVVMSSEVPQNLYGNSGFVRQLMLGLFDSLDRKVGLSEVPVKVNVTLGDIEASRIILCFTLSFDAKVKVDRRDLSSSEGKLIEALDLEIVRRMVLSENGEMHVSVEDGTVSIEFTVAFSEPSAEQVAGEETEASQQIMMMKNYVRLSEASVLIVDDNEINQKIIQMFIQDKVGRVTLASNGRDALKLFENSKFDLVLMDLQMPEMDGFVTARKMREVEMGVGNRVPIIAVTANAYEDNERKCIEAGMDGYISKPFKADDLIKLMEEKLDL